MLSIYGNIEHAADKRKVLNKTFPSIRFACVFVLCATIKSVIESYLRGTPRHAECKLQQRLTLNIASHAIIIKRDTGMIKSRQNTHSTTYSMLYKLIDPEYYY